ncbi:MAG TPA: hypothetical protein VKM72_21230 [Thermoanaerobaculia bacterium]|nr:hypothetical protein [Thermoanaerobaculia bacterium]
MRPLHFLLALSCALTTAAYAAGDVHSVDFRNFVYHPSCADFESSDEAKVPVRVSGGRFEASPGTDLEGTYFEVREIVYGDLTGDGSDEAIVRTLCSTGGTGRFDEGFVYGMKDGKPVLLGRIPGGDRASGGVRCVRVEDGALMVERTGNETGAAMGIDFIDTETWKLQGGKLAETGTAVHRPIGSTQGAKPIRFAKGTSSGTVRGTTSGMDQYVLQAREGQTMTVRLTAPKKNAAFEIMIDDYTVTCRTTEWTGELPGGGTYRIFVLATKGSASYELSVGIR